MSKKSVIGNHSVVCLMAPTASGKTALAYELYDSGRYEIISVDSALIYQDMDIGTAKPTKDELLCYPHHLVDIIEPTQSYSVAEFVQDIEQLIDAIHNRGKIPLLVGGTMMYYMALFDGLSALPDSDVKVRAEVEAWRQAEGIEALHSYLSKVDPLSFERLKPNDSQRITRAIEVYRQSGRPISDWQAQPKQALAQHSKYQWYAIAVMPDRAWLHKRIEQRLAIMWQQGLLEEVIGLLESHALTPDMPSMRSVGYRQVLEYLTVTNHPVLQQAHLETQAFYDAFLLGQTQDGLTTVSLPKLNSDAHKLACLNMQNKALYATRQLAKRQTTWLRKLIKLSEDWIDSAAGAAQSQSVNASELAFMPVLHTFNTIEQARRYLE
ncbi:MAG: tRNA (adenosine(37)-N6)-dimethylallyltransferase MiaA [Psychrobacter sp.]|nr:tRNA (adenosine(37)-N6)-dimethylallyltransferase MiaA [Psychrobacter sp.]